MNYRVTIEDRLESFAAKGQLGGFTLKLWNSKAKSLQRQGIVLHNPVPTEREGEIRYEIDFSIPVPGTLSQQLYDTAMKVRKQKGIISPEAEPHNPPYSMD